MCFVTVTKSIFISLLALKLHMCRRMEMKHVFIWHPFILRMKYFTAQFELLWFRYYIKVSSVLLQLFWHESSEDCLFNQTTHISKYYKKKKKKRLLWRKKHTLTFTTFPLRMRNSFCISAKACSMCRQSYGPSVEESDAERVLYLKHCG